MMDLGQGFPILAQHLGTGSVFMGGHSAYCMVWSDVPGVHQQMPGASPVVPFKNHH